MNRKAQEWWSIRRRAQKTFRWVVQGMACRPDKIISISSKCPLHHQLITELSRPTYSQNGVGKILINKKPNGQKSPNLADAAMMPSRGWNLPRCVITPDMIAQIRRAGFRRR